MRILSVISAFPPHYYGGGEISAYNLASVLKSYGHEIGVVTMADKGEELLHGADVNGMSVWRLRFPRPYAYWNHVKASKWLKPLWYLQDHFDPRNRTLMASCLDAFKPDCVLVHVVTGIGYNSLREIGKRRIPTIYFMHDLNLACLWGGMFKNGQTCVRRCWKCKIASFVRFSSVTSIPTLGFCSPSSANFEKAASVLPLRKYKHAAIFNANQYPTPTTKYQPSDKLRFLFVGRLHYTKGVDFILEILEELAESHNFVIDILGEGVDGSAWRERFGKHAWCRFHGHVSQQEVSNFMAQSDVLLVPSIWQEPLGGVVIQSLVLGVPVFGSAVGGIPELIDHEKTGLLLPPGDKQAWKAAFIRALNDRAYIQELGRNARADSGRFDQNFLGHKLEAFIQEVVASQPATQT